MPFYLRSGKRLAMKASEIVVQFKRPPEILFGKLDSFALLSIPMFIIMGASISSTRAGADLYEALERWLTRVPGGLVISNLGACALFAAMSGSSPATCAAIGKLGSLKCGSAATRMKLRQDQ